MFVARDGGNHNPTGWGQPQSHRYGGNQVARGQGNHKGLPLHTVDVASVLSPKGFADPSWEV